MCKFIETICIRNGIPRNLEYHAKRLNDTRSAFFPNSPDIDLNEFIIIPSHIKIFPTAKCRIDYDNEIREISFAEYFARHVNSLKLIYSDEIDYSYKYNNRKALESLYLFRDNCDDILIVKNGFITDTSIHNIAFFDGKQWFTPEMPMLCGTMRSFLSDKGIIIPKSIHVNDLKHFSKARLFNAMISWDDEMDIEIGKIIF